MSRYLLRFFVVIVMVAGSVAGVADDTIGWHDSGKNGAVAAGHPDSVAAGIRILRDGGRAADAAAATILALAVTDYGLFAMGGEVPVLIYDADSRQVKCLSGLGSAPSDPEAIDWFMKNGIPPTWAAQHSSRPWHLLTTNTGAGYPHAATAEKGEQLMAVMVERLSGFLTDLASSEITDRFPY